MQYGLIFISAIAAKTDQAWIMAFIIGLKHAAKVLSHVICLDH
jgi:hypothetical protein